jgi:hypothetical protein
MPGNDLFGTTLEIAGAGAGVSAAGQPRLPIRLMAALLYLKHAFNLSDEELVARWSENVVWQYFSGQDNYTPHTALRWRLRLGAFARPSAKPEWKSCSRQPSTPPVQTRGRTTGRIRAGHCRHHRPGESHRPSGG